MFWMMSPVSGSIEIVPRGLSHFIPFIAPMSKSPSDLPPVFFECLVDQVHAVGIAADLS